MRMYRLYIILYDHCVYKPSIVLTLIPLPLLQGFLELLLQKCLHVAGLTHEDHCHDCYLAAFVMVRFCDIQ